MRLSSIRPWLPLLLALLVAAVLRVALWEHLPGESLISDEAEYLAAADWLAQGRGFAWHQEWLWTRAPLYPLFLAAHMRLFGFALAPIFLSQTMLSLLNVALVYVLARQLEQGSFAGGFLRSSTLAALLAAVYLPFATYPQLILSETLYITLLLGAFVALGRWSAAAGGPLWRAGLLLLAAGLLLGLATLTRGLTLGFLPLVLLWLLLAARRQEALRRWGAAALLGLTCAGVVLPWSLYASRTYGGPVIVDTTGAFNLLLGARTAYDGERRDAPTRNFVLALLNERLSDNERRELLADACLLNNDDPRLLAALQRSPVEITQAERQQLMTAEGLCLLRAAPGAFARKSLSELADLFNINYTGSERLSGGFALGRLPPWYAAALFLLDDTLYVLVLPLAVLGWAALWHRARHDNNIAQAGVLALAGLVGLWWLYNLLTAPLLFAINRFRMPLLPFAFIFAALAVGWLSSSAGRRLLIGRAWAVVMAGVLALLAWTPHAYVQEPPAAWASYVGPYPSSVVNTRLALQNHDLYLRQQQLTSALGAGAAAEARALLAARGVPVAPLEEALLAGAAAEVRQTIAASDVPTGTVQSALPLISGLEGRPQEGLELQQRLLAFTGGTRPAGSLPAQATGPLPPATEIISATKDWRAAVVRGDLLRRLGDEPGAKAAFTPGYVDDQNPVDWAWRWLHPAPTARIDLGGNLDLGYIQGFYLGEGDQTAEGDGTFRWSAGEAWLRFPEQGSGAPQHVCLRADGRGWPADLERPRFRLLLHTTEALLPFEELALQGGVEVYCTQVPPVPPGNDIVLVLRSPTFVPGAADLLAQQGPQAGQLRLLGLRLDWVELTGDA